MISRTWYHSDDDELRRLVAEGLNSYDIADRMGRTRSSILARMPRIGAKSQCLINQTWTEQDDAALRQMVAENCTARQMAEKLNTTRNAIIGRMRRINLKSGWLNQYSMGDRKPATKGEKSAKTRERWKAWQEKNPRPPKVRSALSPIVAAERLATMRRNQERRQAMQTQTSANAVHILDARHDQCRWPLWADGAPFSELNFCGCQKEAGSSYCPAHAYRASNVVKGVFVPLRGFTNSWRAA